MKSKTINKILNAKINDWLSSINDEKVRQLARRNTIVTGGCIASMLLQEPVNDYDIYFQNRETAFAVANYYLTQFAPKNKEGIPVPIFIDDSFQDRVKIVVQSSGIASEKGTTTPYDYFESREEGAASNYVGGILQGGGVIEDTYDDLNEKAQEVEDGEKYRPIFVSTNAITLSHRLQLVLRFFGSPEEIHENYDYVHCTNYYSHWDNNLVLKQAALEALLARELRYVGSKYPLCSIMRMRKFIKRGWSINAGQVLKAIMQLQELDLNDPAVLEDQLTGVDSAYFVEVLNKLKDKNSEKINTAYLIEIIDRIF